MIMKKFTKVIAAILVLATLVCVFASCGKKLSGKYTAQVGADIAGYKATYAFSGSKVTVTKTGTLLGQSSTTTIEGKYEIVENDNGMEITFTFESEDGDIKSGTYALEEGDGYIKIAGIKYTKAD